MAVPGERSVRRGSLPSSQPSVPSPAAPGAGSGRFSPLEAPGEQAGGRLGVFWLVCAAGGGWSDAAKRSSALGNVLLAASNPEYYTGPGRPPLGLPRAAAGFQHPEPKAWQLSRRPAAQAARAKARLRERVNSSQSGWSFVTPGWEKDRFIVAAYLTEVSVTLPDLILSLNWIQNNLVSPWLVPV